MEEKPIESKKVETTQAKKQEYRLVRQELQAVILAISQEEANKIFDELLKKLNELNNA